MKIKEGLSGVASGIDNAVDRLGRTVGMKIPEIIGAEKDKAGLRIVRRYTTVSFVAGFIPIPFVDLAAITASQLAMLSEIAGIYETGKVANKERLRIVVSSVLGSVVPQGLTVGFAGSAIKALPVIGTAAGMVLMPALSSAVTFALGRAFISHFESGGTVLDLDPEKLKEYYKAHLREAAVDDPALTPVEIIETPPIVGREAGHDAAPDAGAPIAVPVSRAGPTASAKQPAFAEAALP
jgi:uncharacterized protein (DUF697 family)